MGSEFCLVPRKNVSNADGNQNAIDRLSCAMLFQHVKEGEPTFAVDICIRVLGRVATGGVNEHCFFSKPPVAASHWPVCMGSNRKF